MSGRHAFEGNSDGGAAEARLKAFVSAPVDDKRLCERVYDRWVGMLRGRACPSIEDLEPFGIAGPCDVLIDLRDDVMDPALICIGGALVADCGQRGMKRLSDVPAHSFLALLTGHFPQVASGRQPVAFEGERASADGVSCDYRAILLPLSSDGNTVDFVHGTIGWREPASCRLEAEIGREIEQAKVAAPASSGAPIWPLASDDAGRKLRLRA